MSLQPLSEVKHKAVSFVEEGCFSIIREGPLTPERFLISPCPVSSALAIISLLTMPGKYPAHVARGVQYLQRTRNPDDGWGRTPGAPSDERATGICRAAIKCAETGVNPDVIHFVATEIGAIWIQSVPRLIMDWQSDSPLTKILEFFLTSDTGSHIIADISFEHLPVVLSFVPPSGRPLATAISCIKETSKKSKPGALKNALKRLSLYQSPDGSWSEDIFISALAILCLALTGRYPKARTKGLRWLTSVQYQSGAWPSFNQLTNWDLGTSALVAGEAFPDKQELISECSRFLAARANRDGSFGTLSPYSFPDLDDTAIALSGLVMASRHIDCDQYLIDRSHLLLRSLQNRDGSWGTFPEVTGNPPDCTCLPSVHIKSVDVTVHVLQSLLKSGSDVNDSQVQKTLWWLTYQQKWDGSWKSTWYLGNTYATAQVLELLAECDIWPRARQRARSWLLAAQNQSGGWPGMSAGECGLAVNALLKNGEDPTSPVISKGLAFIRSVQEEDGSFKPAYKGLYASGLYYEDPITEALAAIRAIHTYNKITS